MITLAKWSVEDYHRMIAAGILRDRRVELLAGDIVEMSPEGPLHASRIRKVANYLRSLLGDLALVSEAHPITLSESEPEPDVAIVRLPESRYDERHPGSEDIFWLIEIADTTLAKDLKQKKQSYAAAGIEEYWVMDVNANLLTVFRQPQKTDYTIKQEMRQGELAPLAFPNIVVSVNRLFS
jgi:Uma2 family endonuclease